VRTTFTALSLLSLCVVAPRLAGAEEGDRARLVAQALARGDGAAVAHLGDELGPEGLAVCIESGSRSERLLCAQAARHLFRPWEVLPALATVLRSHDRHLAACAAESMVAILSDLESGDLGAQEALPAEVESLLRGLERVVSNHSISPDVRALSLQAAGAVARIAGAGLAVPRAAIDDEEPAVRRAAIAALVGSDEPEDLSALSSVVQQGSDLFATALAAGGICEVTAGRGRPLPAPTEERIRALLQDERARPSIVSPVLACVARASGDQVAELRAMAGRHPNEATRAAYRALVEGEDD